MFVSGFTFVRNAINFDYPIYESITSLLPLVDELIVCVGNSSDQTLKLIESINDHKIKIVHSIWNDNLREGGRVLADETNKAFAQVSAKANWCIYLQADEVIHEDDYSNIREAMRTSLNDNSIEGLLFNYVHFYGSYNYIGDSRRWYRHEIRIIRNNRNIYSYKDAQGFRIDNRKLKVKSINARIFHYGWVKNPDQQLAKQKSFHKLWHSDEVVNQKIKNEPFDYSEIDALRKFTGTHPKVMSKRVNEMNWTFNYDTNKHKLKAKDILLNFIERITGYRLFEYKNYRM